MSLSQLFFRQIDKQLQRACDLLLCRPWPEIATSNTDCWHERRKHVNKTAQASKAVLNGLFYRSLSLSLSLIMYLRYNLLSKGASVSSSLYIVHCVYCYFVFISAPMTLNVFVEISATLVSRFYCMYGFLRGSSTWTVTQNVMWLPVFIWSPDKSGFIPWSPYFTVIERPNSASVFPCF